MSKHIERIAIFRALYLGDMLLAVPALRSIRAGFPDAEITLIGLPWAADFTRRFSHYIDRFVEFAGYPGIAEVEVDPVRTRRFLAEQRAYKYDLVIQMHGNGQTSNPFVLDLKARMTAGYYKKTAKSSRARLTYGMPYPDHWPEVLRNLGLARLLGCDGNSTALEFPLFQEDHSKATNLLRMLPRAHRPWIGLHAGSRSPARRWPTRYFAQLADYFANRYHAQIILTGSSDDSSTVQEVARYMKARPLDLAGKTSLGGLAAIISQLDLFISNDTGPSHIANAVDTPGLTIFGPADPLRWAPLNQARHPIIRKPVECSPCGYWECPIDHRCLEWLKPEMVIELAEKLLTKGEVACNA